MHPSRMNQTSSVASGFAPTGGIAAAGVAGALIAGSMAAAKEIRAVRTETGDRAGALVAVARESLGAGLAAAAGAFAARTAFRSGPLALLTLAAVSVGVKYAYDGLTGKGAAPQPVEAKAGTGKNAKTK